ncbi:MAG: lytic transglycosylase domain-containing protein [Bacteroidota bacterium]
MRRSIIVFASLVVSFSIIAVFSSSMKGGENPNPPQEIETTILPQMVKAVDMNKDFYFAGERIPTENHDVKERLDYELTTNAYRHGKNSINMKRAARYFPIFEKVFEEYEIPQDLKYIALAESDLSNATSPAGAKGIWQFMSAVGKEYGLEINSEVDERYHVEKATVAAAKHLRFYHRKFGSWTLATAAYNGGIGRISSSLRKQRGGTLYDLNLNQETSRYVFRVIAFKEILENPKKFGYYLEEDDLYAPLNDYYIIEVNSTVENLADFARDNGISYRQLKRYNPWLRKERLTNARRKTYEIKIPYQKF